jgi:hypothetical protein
MSNFNPNSIPVVMNTHIAFADGRSFGAGEIAIVTPRQARHLIENGAAIPNQDTEGALAAAEG